MYIITYIGTAAVGVHTGYEVFFFSLRSKTGPASGLNLDIMTAVRKSSYNNEWVPYHRRHGRKYHVLPAPGRGSRVPTMAAAAAASSNF